jgi:RNase P protein component
MDTNKDIFIIVKPVVLELDFSGMKKELEYLFNKQKLLKGDIK